MVRFTGILVAEPPECEENIPSPFIAIPQEERHITLLSSELGKDARKALKAMDLSVLPAFPEVTFSGPYIADNGKKCSIACNCREQDAIRAWVESAVAVLGISTTIDPSRVYHVSLGNMTGSPYDSVPDPWNHRVR